MNSRSQQATPAASGGIVRRVFVADPGVADAPWERLPASRRGLIQTDGEGFYDGQHLILET
jgi:hypothetical protein